ncbi:MAG: GNAT family N-acetyltransferase [Gammaproteobacteria bacterium]|nr:GNAT family N-acetyltransferase [Gammaproteobacteria bacterium]|tara:strand:- start:92 stop:547 length:456 start_codon:yes stop_codon:yes gene_type:complete
MSKFQFRTQKFKTLNAHELYSLLRLRSEVFVVEQECIYQDIDDFDLDAIHVCGHNDGEIVAYSRLLAPGIKYVGSSIGRVLTKQTNRGTGLGKALLKESIAQCQQEWPAADISLSAQKYLEKFYSGFGFETKSAAYMEDGMPHIQMTKKSS